MKELLIIASNEAGSLANVAEALGAVGVNIEAISAYGLDDRAIFRIITADASTAVKALSRVPAIEVRQSEVLIHRMINRPGELGKITRKLANKGVNLETIYIVSRKQDFTEVAILPVPSDLEKAREVLGVK